MVASVNGVSQDLDLTSNSQQIDQVETHLAQFIERRSLPSNLERAIRYSLLGEGKRLRPILTLRCCKAVGGQADQALAAAAAIEMIHCFSLVHDDLPAMDDDDLRRGRPTLHKHANEAMAILAGDAMMALAFEIIATEVMPGELARRILLELSTATNDMIAGQVYDTVPEFDETLDSENRLETVHRNKTGALIGCACRMGALCGQADTDALAAITTFGQAIGLMFQVVDDILDVTQTTEQLGKTAHKDAEHGKLTYPLVVGIEGSRQQIQRLKNTALTAIESLDTDAQPLRDLCQYMAVRTR